MKCYSLKGRRRISPFPNIMEPFFAFLFGRAILQAGDPSDTVGEPVQEAAWSCLQNVFEQSSKCFHRCYVTCTQRRKGWHEHSILQIMEEKLMRLSGLFCSTVLEQLSQINQHRSMPPGEGKSGRTKGESSKRPTWDSSSLLLSHNIPSAFAFFRNYPGWERCGGR